MATQIREIAPSDETIIATLYDPADYRDGFLIPAVGFATIEDFATAYFSNQPRWLSLVSMNLLGEQRRAEAIGDGSYARGSSIGSWQVHGRSDTEIVFGDDMGFMEYRFSFFMRADRDIEASTAVKYKWPRTSHLYFRLVKPMHRRFVPLSLRAATRENRQLASGDQSADDRRHEMDS